MTRVTHIRDPKWPSTTYCGHMAYASVVVIPSEGATCRPCRRKAGLVLEPWVRPVSKEKRLRAWAEKLAEEACDRCEEPCPRPCPECVVTAFHIEFQEKAT